MHRRSLTWTDKLTLEGSKKGAYVVVAAHVRTNPSRFRKSPLAKRGLGRQARPRLGELQSIIMTW